MTHKESYRHSLPKDGHAEAVAMTMRKVSGFLRVAYLKMKIAIQVPDGFALIRENPSIL